MQVGIPRELKDHEHRVAITPIGVHELVDLGHQVLVEHDAGTGSSIADDEYVQAGARIVDDPDELWGSVDLILKVKEPIPEEYQRMRSGQVLFTYLHLAASRELTEALCKSGISAVAAARVVVLGGGMAGQNAAWIAAGMEAEVVLLDTNVDKLRYVDAIHKGRSLTLVTSRRTVQELVTQADMVIGAVLIPGARAPRLVSRELVGQMKTGAVLVDISIDQGGCFETSHVTTHSEPTYVVDGVVHYCVGNMPGAVPHTSTYALTNVTIPYAVQIASLGVEQAVREDPALAKGVNVWRGELVYEQVAMAHELDWRPLEAVTGGSGQRGGRRRGAALHRLPRGRARPGRQHPRRLPP